MKNSTLWLWGLVIVVVAVVAWYMMNGGSLGKSKGEYQAVFLSNGQVYFGKVSNESGSTVTVKDIYYLQVQQQVQPADEKDKASKTPQVQLVKLGNEIHGPMDEMRINHDQLLFVEDLKSDGKVVTAIKDFQKNGGSSSTPAASTEKKTDTAQ